MIKVRFRLLSPGRFACQQQESSRQHFPLSAERLIEVEKVVGVLEFALTMNWAGGKAGTLKALQGHTWYR